MSKPLRILMVTSECVPFAKAGGLADVVPALAAELTKLGHDVRIVLPRYATIDRSTLTAYPQPLGVPLGDQEYWTAVLQTTLPGTSVPTYFIEYNDFYGRDGIYGSRDEPSFHDNARRFALLSRASFQLCRFLNWLPDVINAHDWPAGLVPVYANTTEVRDFAGTATVFSIHNIGYQGTFPRQDFESFGLPWPEFAANRFEWHGNLNMLHAALFAADKIATVSPGYAEEVQAPALGFGMDHLLRERSGDFVGILNGIDYEVWNPAADSLIPYPYDVDRIDDKGLNKNYLQQEARLSISAKAPLFGMIGRIVGQKGFSELLADDARVIRRICEDHRGQLVILGTGQSDYEERLTALAREIPSLRVYLRFSERMAHVIEAATDFFLMPSHYEPCGLTQMYSLRYGSVPIVSPTGGLRDTVVGSGPEQTGYHMDSPPTTGGMIAAIDAAVAAWSNRRAYHREIQKSGMRRRFSWQRSAEQYATLYEAAVNAVRD